MASSISTINTSLVDQNVVAALRYVLPMLKSFSLGIESEGKIQNDVVYVPIATDPSAQPKTAGTMVTADGTLAGTAVTLSNFYGASWDCAEGAMSPSLFPSYWADKAAGAVYSLAKQVVDAALAVITAANFGNKDGVDKLTVAPADFGQADLALLWQYAGTKIKQRVKSLGLNAAYSGALMGESNLALLFAQNGPNFVATGILPQLIGMNTWAYPDFPANAQNLGGAVFGQSAILAAVAPPAALMDAGDGDIIESRIITDADSGISVLYRTKGTAGGLVSGECSLLYGVAKGQDAVVRLVSE